MINLKWKNIGMIMGLFLLLIVAGCGSENETKSETTDSLSKEVDYTITGNDPGAGQAEKVDNAIEEYESLAGWEHELSSVGAMLTEVDKAIENEEPIIFAAWSPHYMFKRYDIKYLEDPKNVFGDDETLNTIVRNGLKEDMPEAYTILDRINFEPSEMDDALLQTLDKDFDVVAEEWVNENEDIVQEWTNGVDSVDETPFELVHLPWDDAVITANITRIVLEDKGFDVTTSPISPAIIFESIATGDADASLAIWLPYTHGELYDEYEGDFEDLGPNLDEAKIGLAVPKYMDIDSIEDLEPKN